MSQIFDFFLEPYKEASIFNIVLEIIAVLSGIASVWFAKKRAFGFTQQELLVL